uniref:Eukaryotic translation initiation factor 3, subunit H, b n=1 Tax=Astyanax mexicanus TaxID=7994 RepID=A0A8B9LRJ1_ASTMX
MNYISLHYLRSESSASFLSFQFAVLYLQVVLKIIKHYQEEGQGSEVVQGVLLGLVVDDRLEITNCFPFPQHTEDDADFDEGKQIQPDLLLGWKETAVYSGFQLLYSEQVQTCLFIVFFSVSTDPIKTAQGSLSLKAYRLTPKLMEICKEKDFSSEGLKKANVGFESMFEEVPIVIRNSHLISVFLWELEDKSTVAEKHELLGLSSGLVTTHLQHAYNRLTTLLQHYIQRRQQENAQRQSRGEPPLPEEDLSKLFKPPQAPPRMDTLLIAGHCRAVKQFSLHK